MRRSLEDENRRLKKLLAEELLDNAALKDLAGKTLTPRGAMPRSGMSLRITDCRSGGLRGYSVLTGRDCGVGPGGRTMPDRALLRALAAERRCRTVLRLAALRSGLLFSSLKRREPEVGFSRT